MSSGGGHAGEWTLPGLHELEHFIESTNSSGGFIIPGWLMVVLFFVAAGVHNAYAPLQSTLNWNMVLLTGPVWMPIVFGRFAMMQFVFMRRYAYNTAPKQASTLLEIRIPREVLKSPRAMESVFSSLHLGPGEGTWLKKYIWGRTRPWWSFEIVSIGGEVRLYVYTRNTYRRALESYMYSQYPEVEIIEAVDYSRLRDPHLAPNQMFVCEYEHSKPHPYPIKTYVEIGMDKPNQKVEEQVDPFAQVLELFGSIGPGEEIWTQIIIRLTKSERFRGKKNSSGSRYKWQDEAREIVEKIRAEVVNPISGYPNPTEVQKETMAAIERNVAKQAFDVGIRSIYSAPADKYKGMNPFVANMWKPFSSELYNSIVPAGHAGSEKFNDFPWEDIGGFRQRKEMLEMVEMYRRRSYFHPPYRGAWMTMSTEELASIFHIPSSAAKTPSLPRIQSTTSAAPSNLPL